MRVKTTAIVEKESVTCDMCHRKPDLWPYRCFVCKRDLCHDCTYMTIWSTDTDACPTGNLCVDCAAFSDKYQPLIDYHKYEMVQKIYEEWRRESRGE